MPGAKVTVCKAVAPDKHNCIANATCACLPLSRPGPAIGCVTPAGEDGGVEVAQVFEVLKDGVAEKSLSWWDERVPKEVLNQGAGTAKHCVRFKAAVVDDILKHCLDLV